MTTSFINIHRATCWLVAVGICLAVVLGCSQSGDQAEEKKVKIAVLSVGDFVPDATGTEGARQQTIGMPDELAERILEHLTQGKRFVALERKALRRAILEQRFGKQLQKSYLDRTLDRAIAELDDLESGLVVEATAKYAGINDLLHDFKDLGSAVGADYLVVGSLEKMTSGRRDTQTPYSTQGRKMTTLETDARLRLRVIKVASSTVMGAASLRVRTSEQLFAGRKSDTDEFSAWDRLGTEAAAKILDIVYPTTIVNLEPLTISRGANDGVQAKQVFAVLRQGKPISDSSGAVIAHLEQTVGRVEVAKAEQNISLVTAVDGKGFQVGDLVRTEAAPSQGHQTAAAAPSPSAPIGARTVSGPAQLPKVAVGLIKEGTTAAVQEEKAIPLFTDTIISRLTQTKRFQMLDRQEVDQLLNEQLAQAMRDGRDLPSAFGSLAGADYLVYGSVSVLSIEHTSQQLPGTTRTITYSTGYVQGNMRVVDVKAGRIVESRQIKIKRRVEQAGGDQRVFVDLGDAYAEEVAATLMNALYPIKVAAVAPDGTVYLNRGADGGLKLGQPLLVMRQGDRVVDPDTGVQLGNIETVVGGLQVVEVEDARSKAQLVLGQGVMTGDLVKRAVPGGQAAEAAAAARTGAVLPTEGQKEPTTQAQAQAAPAPSGKATLAVTLVRLNPSARTTDVKPGHMERLTDELVNALNNTSRFVLMERREVDRVIDEKVFTAMAGGEDIRDRIKQLRGADYLVVGEVTNLYYDTQRRQVPYVNEVEIDRTGVMEGNFRIISSQTGAVVASEKVRLRDQVKNIDDPTRLMTGLMDRFVTTTVAKVVENIYPIKVMDVGTDGLVYLNRGEDGGLRPGLIFEVMRPGREMKDVDTGLVMGREENKMGTVEVVSVEKSRSKAKVWPGDGASRGGKQFAAGDILRRGKLESVPKPAPQVMQPKW